MESENDLINAVVDSYNLRIREGVLTFNLDLKCADGYFQLFGLLPLYSPNKYKNKISEAEYTGFFINEVFKVLAINDIDDCTHKPLRIQRNEKGEISTIYHFLDDSISFSPEIDIKEYLKLVHENIKKPNPNSK